MADVLPVTMNATIPGAPESWANANPPATEEVGLLFPAESERDAEMVRHVRQPLGEGFCIGTLIGMCGGTLLAIKAAMNTYLVIPAFGLVIPGPIGAAFAGALAGAVAGAVLGTLADRSLQ